MTNKKATTDDIAKSAGVSQSTVSMVLNGNTGAKFSDETVEKVFKAAKQLNYKPSKKRALTQSKPNNCIALVCPTLDNPYYSSLIQTLENEITSREYTTIIFNTLRDPKKEENFLNLFRQFPLSGIIFTTMPFHKEQVEIMSLNIPIVIMSDKSEYMESDTIEINSKEEGILVAEHLIELGHKNIAYITTPLGTCSTQRRRRLEGVQKTVDNFNVKLNVFENKEENIGKKYRLNSEYYTGFTLAEKARKDPTITGYIGVNDMVAYGIMDNLLSQGVRVSEDVSVCGFDNIFPSEFRKISLTTIDSFLLKKGSDSVNLLFRKINLENKEKEVFDIHRIQYRPKLIIRGSTGPCDQF